MSPSGFESQSHRLEVRKAGVLNRFEPGDGAERPRGSSILSASALVAIRMVRGSLGMGVRGYTPVSVRPAPLPLHRWLLG